MSMKNSNDCIGNGTHDHPTCSAVPQQTAPLHALSENKVLRIREFVTLLFESYFKFLTEIKLQ